VNSNELLLPVNVEIVKRPYADAGGSLGQN
jgi:hypothetical protein